MLEEDEVDFNRRELGEEEDLQLALDYDAVLEEKDLRNKILFAVQELGGIRTIQKEGKKIQAYIKGDYCQDSIKDLVKHIRKDVPTNPKVNLILSQFNIVESDLIKLLVLHAEDKKLSFWLLALLSSITSKPHEGLQESEKSSLNSALKQYKKTFMKNEGITYLILHISDYVRTPTEKRQKAHFQMMEFIISILRNLLQFRTDLNHTDELHSHFLVSILKEDMMGPLLYLIQMQKTELIHKIQIPMLEIFFHIFTCFDPVSLFQLKKPINFREQSLKLQNRKSEPVRHSRFLPNFLEKNQSGVRKVIHRLDKKEEAVIPGQRKIPIRLTELKKVNQIENEYVEQNLIIESNDQAKTKSSVRQIIFEYAKEFVEVQFEQLSKLVFDHIYKETVKVSKQNVIQYMMLCSWVLKMTRSKYQKAQMMAKTRQEKGLVQFDFHQILCIMQTGHFELVYKLLFREATREKKKKFDINMFHAALILFYHYIEIIEDISISLNMRDRKNANALMANMFRHDIARVFKIGFHQITHEKILQTLIIATAKFFKLLSMYSKGKVLTIQTNKLLKAKKKKAKREEEDEQFISQDDNFSDGSDSFRQNESDAKYKKQKTMEVEEQLRFQQRKYNEITEFAILADYETISKYLQFLKHERFKNNVAELNIAIFFYFDKIVTLLKGEWLFFQAETLTIFTQLINNSDFCREYRSERETLRLICAKFIQLLKKNKLAIVQSLFRYNSLQTKEQIFKNYASGFEEEPIRKNEDEDNLFLD